MDKIIKGLLDTLETGISGVLEIGGDILSSISEPKSKNEYSASFLPASDLLSYFNKGFCLDGRRSLSIKNSLMGAIIFGSSGVGKSSVILLPNILKMAKYSSLIINSPSGDDYNKSAKYLKRIGANPRILNYSKPEISICYNPYNYIKTESDYNKISYLFHTKASGKSVGDIFWLQSAIAMTSMIMKFQVKYTPIEYHNFYNCLHILNTFAYNPEAIDKLIVKTGDELLISDYKAFTAYGDKTLMGIVASCRAALGPLFSDPAIVKVTSSNNFSIDEYRNNRTCLFITNSVKDMKYYGIITSVFFEQVFGEIMSSLPKNDEGLPIFFLIDEASSLNLTNTMQIALSNVRKHKCGIMNLYQDYNQVVNMYGVSEAKAILTNSWAKVYMPGQPIGVAEELSQILGKYEYVDKEGKKHVRSLLTPDEIRQLNESIIICGNKPGIKVKPKPYYTNYWLNRASKLPCDLKAISSDSKMPPLLPLK